MRQPERATTTTANQRMESDACKPGIRREQERTLSRTNLKTDLEGWGNLAKYYFMNLAEHGPGAPPDLPTVVTLSRLAKYSTCFQRNFNA